MGTTKWPTDCPARVLIDELIAQRKVLGRAQARNAELMVEFADTRTGLDRDRIAGLRAGGFDARYKAGEFAANEASMACSTSRFVAQRVIAMTRRVRAEAPDVWDAWLAGDIDQDKVERVNRALRRLQLDASKVLLNALVVDVAVCKSPEILGRWLNQFILKTEKDLQDERLRRSFQERFVSVRPDLDGMSFLTAELSAVDAQAIDQVLQALAGVAEPGDPRSVQQRRADALVDVVLGKVTNGCHVTWDTNTDRDDHLDDPEPEVADRDGATKNPTNVAADEADDATNTPTTAEAVDATAHARSLGEASDADAEDGANSGGQICGGQVAGGQVGGDSTGRPAGTEAAGTEAWDANDWEQPASVFRPDPRTTPDPDDAPDDDQDPNRNPTCRAGTPRTPRATRWPRRIPAPGPTGRARPGSPPAPATGNHAHCRSPSASSSPRNPCSASATPPANSWTDQHP